MREDVPPLRLYWPVLERLADRYRRAGAGWNFRCPFPAHKNGDANPSAFVKLGGRGELVAHCNGCGAGWREFVRHVGLPVGAWFPDGGRKRMEAATQDSKCVARYEYRDRAGVLVAVKSRWEPGFRQGQPKTFTWKRPVTDPALRDLLAAHGVPADAPVWAKGAGCLHPGTFHAKMEHGGWVLRADIDDRHDHRGPAVLLPRAEVGLYRLPEMLAGVGRSVFVVEGEGKADLLASLGFVAVSGPDGKGKWRSGWGEDFAGRHLIVIPDRDTTLAEDWGCLVGASALRHAAASARLVMLPAGEVPGGKQSDIKDWLLMRFPGGDGTRDEKRAAVMGLVERFPLYRQQQPKGTAA